MTINVDRISIQDDISKTLEKIINLLEPLDKALDRSKAAFTDWTHSIDNANISAKQFANSLEQSQKGMEQTNAIARQAAETNKLNTQTERIIRTQKEYNRTKQESIEKDIGVIKSFTKLIAGIRVLEFGMRAITNVFNRFITPFKESIDIYNKSTEAATKLKEAISDMQRISNVAVVQKVILETERRGAIDEIALGSGAQRLADYVQSTEQLNALIPVVADLSIKLRGVKVSAEGVEKVSVMVGKALRGNAEGLSRNGVVLSAVEKKLIKTGTASQRFEIVMNALEKSVGGLNETLARTTAQGHLQNLEHQLDGLRVKLGEELTPTVVFLQTKWIEAQMTFIEVARVVIQNIDLITAALAALAIATGGGLLLKGLPAITKNITFLVRAISRLGIIGTITVYLARAGTAIAAFATTLGGLITILGATAIAVGALILKLTGILDARKRISQNEAYLSAIEQAGANPISQLLATLEREKNMPAQYRTLIQPKNVAEWEQLRKREAEWEKANILPRSNDPMPVKVMNKVKFDKTSLEDMFIAAFRPLELKMNKIAPNIQAPVYVTNTNATPESIAGAVGGAIGGVIQDITDAVIGHSGNPQLNPVGAGI